MTEQERGQSRLDTLREKWGLAIRGKEVAEAAFAHATKLQAALVERQEAAQQKASDAREQIARDMFLGSESLGKPIAALTQLETECRALELAVTKVARQETYVARQVLLDAEVEVAEAALYTHQANLELHQASVRDQLMALQGKIGNFEVTGYGSESDRMQAEIRTLEGVLNAARRASRNHANNGTTPQ